MCWFDVGFCCWIFRWISEFSACGSLCKAICISLLLSYSARPSSRNNHPLLPQNLIMPHRLAFPECLWLSHLIHLIRTRWQLSSFLSSSLCAFWVWWSCGGVVYRLILKVRIKVGLILIFWCAVGGGGLLPLSLRSRSWLWLFMWMDVLIWSRQHIKVAINNI